MKRIGGRAGTSAAPVEMPSVGPLQRDYGRMVVVVLPAPVLVAPVTVAVAVIG